MILRKAPLWLWPIISGLLLSGGWLGGYYQWLILIGFVPLLLFEEQFFLRQTNHGGAWFYLMTGTGFIVWNTASSFWIWNASPSGAIMAIVFNSFFMTTVFYLFHVGKRRLGRRAGAFMFVVYWIGFEYLHLNWELSWTWLTLGNGLAQNIRIIQWYEYTGVLGGSLWILLTNIFLFDWLRKIPYTGNRKSFSGLVIFAIVMLMPVFISLVIFARYDEQGKKVRVVAVQPNIDPYNDKFGGMPVEEQLSRMITEADSVCDEQTRYVVAPETAIPQGVWEEDLQNHSSVLFLRAFLRKHPGVRLVIGASTYKMYQRNEKPSPTAHRFSDNGDYFDSYNTALQIDTGRNIQIYHKSKLVLGVEKMPFLNSIDWLKDVSIELGGSSGSLGSQSEPSVFIYPEKGSVIAPVICYESIYGEYVTGFISHGARLIFVITNDGWWGNTPGYTQHLSYSSLRAIETRRDIARSANTGISCFIDQRGVISQPTPWWKSAVIKSDLCENSGVTFYVKNGDYLGRIAAFLSVLFFGLFVVFSFVPVKKEE